MHLTSERPQLMQSHIRTQRIYNGPTEIHHQVVARNTLGLKR